MELKTGFSIEQKRRKIERAEMSFLSSVSGHTLTDDAPNMECITNMCFRRKSKTIKTSGTIIS
jgi:hypothetical protein